MNWDISGCRGTPHRHFRKMFYGVSVWDWREFSSFVCWTRGRQRHVSHYVYDIKVGQQPKSRGAGQAAPINLLGDGAGRCRAAGVQRRRPDGSLELTTPSKTLFWTCLKEQFCRPGKFKLNWNDPKTQTCHKCENIYILYYFWNTKEQSCRMFLISQSFKTNIEFLHY